jgi:hypothetical protein
MRAKGPYYTVPCAHTDLKDPSRDTYDTKVLLILFCIARGRKKGDRKKYIKANFLPTKKKVKLRTAEKKNLLMPQLAIKCQNIEGGEVRPRLGEGKINTIVPTYGKPSSTKRRCGRWIEVITARTFRVHTNVSRTKLLFGVWRVLFHPFAQLYAQGIVSFGGLLGNAQLWRWVQMFSIP